MINIAIVDDDTISIKRLTQHIAMYGKDNNREFSVSSFINPIQFLNDYGANYDLIFMDIKMDMMDGISVCRKLRERDEAVCIVFITGFTQYALKGYEVSAFDYIVKPIDYGDFCLKMARILKFIDRSKKIEYITLKQKNGCMQVNTAEILYVEVRGHNLEYHLGDTTVSVRGSLKKAAETLNPQNFARCSEYFIVNLAKISGMERSDLTVGKETLRIGRAYKAAFRKSFEEYILRRK